MQLSDQYEIIGLPTLVVLEPEGEVLARPDSDPALLPILRHLVEAFPKIQALRRRIADAPGEPALRCELGNLYASVGNPEAGIEFLREGVELYGDPVQSDEHRAGLLRALIDLGDLEFQVRGDANAVLRIAERIEALDSGDPKGHADQVLYLKALADLIRGEDDAALRKLEEILARQPPSARAEAAAYWQTHILWHGKKDGAKAASLLRSFLERYPESLFRSSAEGLLESIQEKDSKAPE